MPPGQMLPTADEDPEDGCGPEIREILCNRKYDEKRNTWHAIYEILFGDTEVLPDPGKARQGIHTLAVLLTGRRIRRNTGPTCNRGLVRSPQAFDGGNLALSSQGAMFVPARRP